VNALSCFFWGTILVQISHDFLSAQAQLQLDHPLIQDFVDIHQPHSLLGCTSFISPWSLRLSKIIDKIKDLNPFAGITP
jgi:hypothetical protein